MPVSQEKDVRDWKVSYARKDLEQSELDFSKTVPVSYRPFDTRLTYYTGNSKGFHCYPRNEVMQHFIKGKNIGLITARSNKSDTCDHFFMTNKIIEAKCGERTTQSAVLPLYLYPEEENQDGQQNLDISSASLRLRGEKPKRTPNLDTEIVASIAQGLGLTLCPKRKLIPVCTGMTKQATPSHPSTCWIISMPCCIAEMLIYWRPAKNQHFLKGL